MKKHCVLQAMVLCMIVLAGCNQPIKNKATLTRYLSDTRHGLSQVREVNRIKAAVTFLPWQLIASRLRGTRQQDTAALQVVKSKYYFVLGLSANGKELLRQLPYTQYSEMVQVLAFRMRPYIRIVTDAGKVIQPEDCLFQQTYGMGRENELLLVFDRSELVHAQKLDLKIKEFGLNTGNLDYQIDTKAIHQMPSIAIQ
jgi:hypothetical protein